MVVVYTTFMESETNSEWYLINITVPGSEQNDGDSWMGGEFDIAYFLDKVFGATSINETSSQLREFMACGRMENAEVIESVRWVLREFHKANVPYWMRVTTMEGNAVNGCISVRWTPGMSSDVIYLEDRFKNRGVDWESALGAVSEREFPQKETVELELMHGYMEIQRVKAYAELDAVLGG